MKRELGIHSSSTRQVFFNDTKVQENMLSERGNGFKIAMNALNVGRIKLAVACIDAQRRVINEATGYAKERVQFKVPIINFGAIRAKLADMVTNAYVDESLVVAQQKTSKTTSINSCLVACPSRRLN